MAEENEVSRPWGVLFISYDQNALAIFTQRLREFQISHPMEFVFSVSQNFSTQGSMTLASVIFTDTSSLSNIPLVQRFLEDVEGTLRTAGISRCYSYPIGFQRRN